MMLLAVIGLSLIAAVIGWTLTRSGFGVAVSIGGGSAPGIMALVVGFYLEAQQPYGPYFMLFGLALGLPALFVGAFSALAASSLGR